MMVAPSEGKTLSQIGAMARAAESPGLATQRPSVDVITGLSSKHPRRISFAVSSLIDSRTKLDMGGSRKLLEEAMPCLSCRAAKPQGTVCLLSEKEIEKPLALLMNRYLKLDTKKIKEIEQSVEMMRTGADEQLNEQ